MHFRFCLYLLSALTVAILVTGALSYRKMTDDAKTSAENYLANALNEIQDQYEEASQKVKMLTDLNNNSMLARARNLAEMIRMEPELLNDPDALQKLCNESLADSLIVCNELGVVCVSTPVPMGGTVLGSDYADMVSCAEGTLYENTALLDTNGQSVRLAGVRRKDAPGVVILSFYLEYEQHAREMGNIANLITDMKVGENGYIIAFAEGVQVNQAILPASEAELRSLPLNRLIEMRLREENCFLYATVDNGLRLIGVIPTNEYYLTRTKGMRLLIKVVSTLLLTLLVVQFWLLKRFVLQDIATLNAAMKRIAAGNFDAKVKESASPEFQKLTMNINTMLDSLRSHDDRISEQNQQEAELARSIKESILPNPGRMFAERNDFSMVACLVQSDTLGGDFYDCQMTDEDHLMLVLSSINEQGVPAALHMMYWLAMLRSYYGQMMSPEEMARKINSKMCADSTSSVQVSMFIGLLEISTGQVTCVNAGVHTPLLQRLDADFCELDIPVSAAFGVEADTPYCQCTFEMQPGERLFLCTNALTCMLNEKNEFFGEARLHAALKETAPTLRDIPHLVRTSVRRFVGKCKKVSDYTMLCVELPGQRRSGGSVSVSSRDTAAATDMIRRTLEEVFAAPSDIEIIAAATQAVMSAIPDAPTVRIVLGCTERHARVTLTYTGPENDILGQLPPLALDSATYSYRNDINDIVLYKAIE